MKTVFRKFKDGEIIALFPDVKENNGCVNSYMHIGQHGQADYTGVVRQTKTATEPEYSELLTELKQIGYENIKVYRRAQR